MARKKLKRIQEAAELPNLFVHPDNPDSYPNLKPLALAGPVFLELGCGKGDFSLGLSQLYPDANVIGLDMKLDRLWYGAHGALDQKNDRVRFLKANVRHLGSLFNPTSLSAIWITFPDPHPKNSAERKRLTHPSFLSIYRTLLSSEGLLYLKTDDLGFLITPGFSWPMPALQFLRRFMMFMPSLKFLNF
ncbi:methyltransferase domain-containing protein [Candidatus Peregrinibacteria bacterium]|nr:MAG: methyltransferase domain-containing protein [Candidatus Peregrinibacteria bacterium]